MYTNPSLKSRYGFFLAFAFLISVFPLNAFSQTAPATMDAYVSKLMARMTLEEKIGQLNLLVSGNAVTGSVFNQGIEEKIKKGNVGGLFGMWGVEGIKHVQDIAVKQSRLHIPLIFGLDVIHGHKTIFPIPLAMSCTWDPALLQKGAEVAAKEASAEGIDWVFSPMVDIARDPRWGRISEGSGEDPYLGSQIADAMVRGYQGDQYKSDKNVMASVKHFALYGAVEAGREYNTVDMSRIRMYQDYLPPYRAAVEAGAGSIMSSFNTVDGIPSTGNRRLLTDLLRKQWGFKGFVVSDYTAVNEMTAHGMGDLKTVSALALNAGLDMDMVGEGFENTLKSSLKEGRVKLADIDQACRRILEAKYKLGLFTDPYKYLKPERENTDVFTDSNRTAARKTAEHSFVLLKNQDQLLPLKKKGSIALIGPLADNHRDMLGTWVLAGEWQKSVSVLQGIKDVAGTDLTVLYEKGSNITDDREFMKRLNFSPQPDVTLDSRTPDELLKEALETARKADIIVAVVGESQSMTGEASSRSDIDIPESQKNLLKELAKLGKPIVLVLFNGRPLTLTWEDAHLNAILDVWAPGTEAGHAIADVLFGNYNPSGKLSATFPRSVGQIPLYYSHKNTGRPFNGTGGTKFKSDYLDISNEPLYPFGYGLSYTTFSYGEIKLNKSSLKGNEELNVTVELSNEGSRAGEETVQLYLRDMEASISPAVKQLKRFKKVFLQPGEKKTVKFSIHTDDLKFYNSQLAYVWEPGEFKVEIGPNSRDVKSASLSWLK